MGSLSWPGGAVIYLDTQAVIYAVEGRTKYLPPLIPLFSAIQSGSVSAVASELTVMEALVGPYKSGDVLLERQYEDFFQAPGLRLLPITLDVLRSAARLRATVTKLRTPDVIHSATAVAAGVSLLVTNDPAFHAVPGLTVEVLDDVIARP